MRTSEIPWGGGNKIKCCKDCVAPKRHLGCHDTCKEYKKEKAEHEAAKQKEREEKEKAGYPMGKHDFDMIGFVRAKRRKG